MINNKTKEKIIIIKTHFVCQLTRLKWCIFNKKLKIKWMSFVKMLAKCWNENLSVRPSIQRSIRLNDEAVETDHRINKVSHSHKCILNAINWKQYKEKQKKIYINYNICFFCLKKDNISFYYISKWWPFFNVKKPPPFFLWNLL